MFKYLFAFVLLLTGIGTSKADFDRELLVVNPSNSNQWVKLTLHFNTDQTGWSIITGELNSHGCETYGVKVRFVADTWNYVLSADFPSSGGGWSNPTTDSDFDSVDPNFAALWDKIQFAMPPGKTSYFRYGKWNSSTPAWDQPKFVVTINGSVTDKDVAVQTGDHDDQIFCGLTGSTEVVRVAMNGGNDLFAADPSSLCDFVAQLGAGDDVAQAGSGSDDYVFPGTGTNTVTNFEQTISGNEESWWTW